MSEWSEHREALAYFVKNQTSIGCYGGGGRLAKAEEAMRYFAHNNGLGKLFTELDEKDERIAELEGRLRRAKEHLLLVEKHQSVDWHTQELKDRFYEALEACCNDD